MKTTEENVCDIIGNISTKNDAKVEKDIIEKRVSGIYKIINKINGKYYVGSSNDINWRWYQHKYRLINKTHVNKHLQCAWNKYGKDNFDFIIIEEIEKEKLISIEQKYLNIAKTEQDKCYNNSFIYGGGVIYKTHPMKGKHHTEESNRKNRKANKISHTGEKNIRYNKTIYTFYNKKTTETFNGTVYNFYKKYNLCNSNVYGMLKHKIKQVCGWVINPNTNLERPNGKSHYLSDQTTYVFYNKNTKEKFEGLRSDFRKKYNLNPSKVHFICKGIRSHHKGWTIIQNPLVSSPLLQEIEVNHPT